MKANNLVGDYCMSCASILDGVQREHRRVIVLDSQCLAVFQQTGDAERLEAAVNPPVENPVTIDDRAELSQVPEVVKGSPKAEPKKAAKKPAKKR